jgi:hypothetical protein
MRISDGSAGISPASAPQRHRGFRLVLVERRERGAEARGVNTSAA